MTVCKFHGGKTPVGSAAPAFRHGRYSKVLPTGLLAHYETAKHDQDLLALRDELALVDARISELLTAAAAAKSPKPSAIWEAVGPLIEQRRRLVETESKRVKDLHSTITAERAYALIVAVAEAVRRHVSDHRQLAAINAEFARLTRGGDSAPADA